MGNLLASLPHGGRVAIIRLRSLGDCVLTTPAVRLLKEARPDLDLAVVVEPRFAAVFECNPAISSLLPPKLPALRDWGPDLCLNLHGGTRSMAFALCSGARFRAGFAHFRHSFLLNVRIPTAQEILGVQRKVHTAEHMASAVFWLGAPRVEIPRAELFVDVGQPARSGAFRPAAGFPAGAVIHPVASAPDKTWPAQGFLAVASHLRAAGMHPVFIGGAGDDLSAFADFDVRKGAPLAEIKALLSHASLFIGNDSGPAHMAAAFGVPSVVLFGASDLEVWRPWKAISEVITAAGGIHAIEPPTVIAAVERLGVHA